MQMKHTSGPGIGDRVSDTCAGSAQRRILIAMMEVGGCHKSIGLAIRDAIETLRPGEFHIEVVDLPHACGAFHMDRFLKALWKEALARPAFTTRMNALIDPHNLSRRGKRKHLARSNGLVRMFFSEFVRKGMRFVRDFHPDLVITTHFFCTSAAVLARERYGLDFRVVAHVSDPFEAHSLWVNPLADDVVVCSEQARTHMEKLGQAPETLTVFPFPIANRFFKPVARTREEILSSLGLEAGRPTFLVSAGGEGIGNTARYVRMLYLSDFPINLIAVCGRNDRLLRELRLLSIRPSAVRLVPLGFVGNMEELVEACDVGLVKAGPSTLFELLAKGRPVMVTHVAAKVEQGNLDFVTANGLGWDVRDPEIFLSLIPHLLVPGFLAQCQRRILENAYVQSLPFATTRLAQWLCLTR